MNKLKEVVSIVGSNNNIILYFIDGECEILHSNEATTKKILEKLIPSLEAGLPTFYDPQMRIDENTLSFTVLRKLEEKTSGIKFFKILKDKLLGTDKKAITQEDVYSWAIPVDNSSKIDEKTEILVAVVESKEEPSKKKVITEVERLTPQIKHFVKQQDAKGFQRFMERISMVIDQRRHSVEDLLEFMRTADLPIADDGCIIAYKRLKAADCKDGVQYFVDSHTGRVRQRVGSFVHTKAELVDPNRASECSNGLHVGRRDYMGQFNGPNVVIVKVAPEDVIAVPQGYGRSKMRTVGYLVVAKLDDEAFNAIVKDKAITDNNLKMQKLIQHIIEGNHTPVIEDVFIQGHSGSNILVTPIEKTKEEIIKKAIKRKTEPKKKKKVEGVEALQTKTDKSQITVKDIKNNILNSGPTPQQLKKLKSLDPTISKAQAARDLGISTRTLGRWLDKYK